MHDQNTTTEMSRRRVLGAVGGGVATLTATGTATAQSDGSGGASVKPDFGGWLDGVDGGYRDARGQDSVTVEVGVQGNDGPFAFAPAALWVDPGTTVTFKWVSDGHNAVPESVPDGASWQGHSGLEDTGFTTEFTFETGGLYTYVCEPHRSLGMKGGLAVGDNVPTTEVATPTPTPSPSSGGFEFPGGENGVIVPIFYGLLAFSAVAVLTGEVLGAIRRRL